MNDMARMLHQEQYLKKWIPRGMVVMAISFPGTLVVVYVALTSHQAKLTAILTNQ